MKVIYAEEGHIKSFHAALSQVAKERIYIEMIEAPNFTKTEEFQKHLIDTYAPVYYALDGDKVVGWADVTPLTNPRLAHRGSLGMGLIASHRGKGLGTQLLSAVLKHAKEISLEKVELTVYTENTAAIKLYRKLGFENEGLIKNYRKLDGRYFDCLNMAKFL